MTTISWSPPTRTTAETVQFLIDCGMTMQDIARDSGCHHNTVRNVRNPDAPVAARTAKRIAAVRARMSSATVVPAFGATRRIRAAAAIGHTETAFAAQADLKLAYVSELAAALRPYITALTHDRIDNAYQALLTLPAPVGRGASRARNRARAAGWPTPDQWDNEIDNPDANPQTWLRSDNTRIAEDVIEDAEFIMHTTGANVKAVALRLGVARSTLQLMLSQAHAKAGAA